MQQFCAFDGVPDPCEVLLAGGGQILLHTLADTGLTWDDGTTGTIPADTLAIGAYGGTGVDNHLDIYYALAKKGSGVPVLVKEKDIATADSLVGANWAKWRRIENGVDMPTPQP